MIITNGVGITTLKNGAAVKRVLSAANSTVNKGVYDATLLETVDADLAAANILTGKNIFGKDGVVVPGVDVSDADAAVGDVKDPKTFYSVAAPRKTGTMPTVAIVAANDDYPAGYHAGEAGGLDAIDLDLAAANIKSGVTIFGKAGTYAQTITHDVQDSDWDGNGSPTSVSLGKNSAAVAAGSDATCFTKTLTCAQATVIEAFVIVKAWASEGLCIKLQLYIDGVAQGESAYLPDSTAISTFHDMGYQTVASGNRIVYLNAHNYDVSSRTVYLSGGMFAGCCKNV